MQVGGICEKTTSKMPDYLFFFFLLKNTSAISVCALDFVVFSTGFTLVRRAAFRLRTLTC